eukprot:2405576-Rhodomonas_salina.1
MYPSCLKSRTSAPKCEGYMYCAASPPPRLRRDLRLLKALARARLMPRSHPGCEACERVFAPRALRLLPCLQRHSRLSHLQSRSAPALLPVFGLYVPAVLPLMEDQAAIFP